MKRFATILIIFVTLISCKNDPKSQVEPSVDETEAKDDGLTLLKGEFLYLADAAVLQTQREIYEWKVAKLITKREKKTAHKLLMKP